MSVSVTMPRLGESVSEGTVTRWLKQEGEQVEADEPLLEVSTDKVDTEIPSPAGGVLQAIKVAEDETVEVGSELAIIDDGAGGGSGASEDAAKDSAASDGAGSDSAADDTAASDGAGSDSAASDSAAPPAADPETSAEQAPGESPADPAPAEETSEPAAPSPPAAPAQRATDSGADGDGGGNDSGADGGPSYVTPLVRRLAAEHGVDLGDVTGTGVGGRIRKQDVLDAAASGSGGGSSGGSAGGSAGASSGAQPAQRQPDKQPAAAQPAAPQQRIESPANAPSARPVATADQATRAAADTSVRGRTEKLSRLRTVIAQRMTESLQVSAQLTTVVEADLTGIARLRDRAKRDFESREGVRLTYLPFFALATCEALREHPAVNASIDLEAGTATYHDSVHLGVAVDTPRGLLVPVVKDASDLNLAGLARRIDDLAERTRENHITPDELGGGTFTLTNTGSRGALFDTPIINQPQVGILGTGTVVKRPVVIDDPSAGEVIAIRHIAYLALTYDHRMVDGADAARFLTTVKSRLEAGEFEAELGL